MVLTISNGPFGNSCFLLALEDGTRLDRVVALAKSMNKHLKLGKPGHPQIYTQINDLQICLNFREKEALNLNYGSLQAAWLCLPGSSGHVFIFEFPSLFLCLSSCFTCTCNLELFTFNLYELITYMTYMFYF